MEVDMRRIALFAVLIGLNVLLVGCPEIPIFLPSQFTIEQGGKSWSVSALSNGENVEEFHINNDQYGMTTTGIERSDVSELFLWNGPNGTSLVMIHDKHNDGSGGAVSFRIDGLSMGQGEWVILDDFNENHKDFDSETDTDPDWRWWPCCSDGGVFRGGLDGPFTITIDPAFNEKAERSAGGRINEWHFLSGSASNPERIELDMNQPITIRRL